MKYLQLIIEHKEAIGTISVLLYEIIVRLVPTAKNWSIIPLAIKLFDLIPNKAADGGTHKITTGVAADTGKEVTSSNGSPASSAVPVIILALFSACLFSCSHKLQPVTTVTKDSVITREITKLHDTVIYIPGASIRLVDTLPCPEAQAAETVTQSNLSASVKISHGVLTVDCKADSLKQRIAWLESQMFSLSKSITTIKIPVPGPTVIKYKVPKWCWWLLVIFIGWLYIEYHKTINSIAASGIGLVGGLLKKIGGGK